MPCADPQVIGDLELQAYLLPIFLGRWPRHIQVLSQSDHVSTKHPKRLAEKQKDIERSCRFHGMFI
jgi:hypothetical protein